ncbi:fungal specific transcription factor domain-containing protein [Penicillium argentinense]|uniref:Fungal specific transcription factor domain-containing protein n=1 Tax=Penicillium argentinense TaxID=1131581 RepID=A0A9W9G0U6_9EURO|nr:fungal specific transcription factor domain-containing protein [Penicillium argentinense]KAJ5110029.1 fungal specific transcription factor domain-containing protein [Penicillium argentinense]
MERATHLHSQALSLLATELLLAQLDETGSCEFTCWQFAAHLLRDNAWCHLHGAKILLEYHNQPIVSPCITFFRKVFQYFNVMLALSLGRRPLIINGVHGPEFTDKVDNVFGCAGRSWPLKHRLADLIGRVRLGEDGRDEAQSLMGSLEAWSIDSLPTMDAYMEAMVQIARAYKFSGLLMLRMATNPAFQDHSGALEASDQDLYQFAFNSVLRVCVLSMPMATLTWPLYVVGRLAGSTSDRTIIMHIFRSSWRSII